MSEKRSLTLPVLRQCVGFNIKKIKKDVDLSNQQLTDLGNRNLCTFHLITNITQML